jgi:glycosyltransferase involved in cell wall biosynthesis
VKVLFDCRYIRLERHDGISRYTAGLVTELAKLHPVTMLICDERQLDMLPRGDWVLGPSPTSILEPFAGLRLNRHNPDIVFSPLQTIGPFGRKFRLVTTVHDLIYYVNRTPPRDLSWFVRLVWRLYHLTWGPQRFLLSRADAHATVSAATKALMLEHRLTTHPIAIVPNAVDRRATESRQDSNGRDLVYMGSFMPYKNVELLVSAMALLPGYRLHLLSAISAADRRRLESLGIGDSVIFHNGVTDNMYFELLGSAHALVSASRNEGFGLPVIEAMAVATPVVLSDIPAFREVAGDAGVFFNENSTESFAEAVRSLAAAQEWNARSRQLLIRSADFSWASSAEKLLVLLRASVD